MSKNKKTILTCALLITVSVLLSGCFNSTGQIATSPEPTGAPYVTTDPAVMSTPGTAPDATAMPGAQTPQQTGNPTPFDWPTQATAVEGRINMFSEIQESYVVTSGQTALVGVVFANAYKGEMTQRIRDMIAGEVMGADTAITVVAVTAEQADVERIRQLAERQRAGESEENLKAEVDEIAKNATTLR